MVGWWVGNAIFIFIVIPLVVILLQRLAKSVFDIGKHVDTIHNQVGGIVVAADDVKQLVPTRDRVRHVAGGLTRYVQAVARVL